MYYVKNPKTGKYYSETREHDNPVPLQKATQLMWALKNYRRLTGDDYPEVTTGYV